MVFGEHTMIGAVGVGVEGHKHVLGIREGATENATVVMELLQDIAARIARRQGNKRRLTFARNPWSCLTVRTSRPG